MSWKKKTKLSNRFHTLKLVPLVKSGTRSQVYIDNMKMDGVTAIEFHAKAEEIPTATITVLANKFECFADLKVRKG